jgi:hypothetical protein
MSFTKVSATKFKEYQMQKGVKIVLRKRITEESMIAGFEKLSGIKLPPPPLEEPKELHVMTSIWTFDLSKESGIAAYKELLELFELPFKTNGAKKLLCKMRRFGWHDVIFEAHEWDDLYEELHRRKYI